MKQSLHFDFGNPVTRSNPAKANERLNYKIFEEFVYYLIDLASEKLSYDDFEIKGKVYTFNLTTIDLCLRVLWWTGFRKTKGEIKLHAGYDITTQIQAFNYITEAPVHKVNALNFITFETGAYYIFDRGNVDFERLSRIAVLPASFAVRAKIQPEV